ncbi:hypothetical protein AVEN_186984-1 [Araneus ventricosus]|uniref:Uncharacterized protein n=1 Tax=Araneus ventricosus TaxID=182803 RepID=A0A4Y2H3C2_ARAVE|nr:hypothetical protein AVEN_186984-1 [Araneus ventricosus]
MEVTQSYTITIPIRKARTRLLIRRLLIQVPVVLLLSRIYCEYRINVEDMFNLRYKKSDLEKWNCFCFRNYLNLLKSPFTGKVYRFNSKREQLSEIYVCCGKLVTIFEEKETERYVEKKKRFWSSSVLSANQLSKLFLSDPSATQIDLLLQKREKNK